MATIFHARENLQLNKNHHQHGPIVEEIEGLIKLYKNGHTERPEIVPNVPPTLPLELGVTAKDITINNSINLWARVYVPTTTAAKLLPVLVYFHGGGFCVGSAAWSCYHNFLGTLSSKASCVILSVNYRLAPENRLPVAYDDGFNLTTWIKQMSLNPPSDQKWWLSRCNFLSLFIVGDSAGANIAHHVATRLTEPAKGTILIQPFFGGETRTKSERIANSQPNSMLSLSASDAYWRLALPVGASRDHPWCNPLANGVAGLSYVRVARTMVCVSDLDILRDRELEFCDAMASAGKRVEKVVYRGVGHGFQVLCNSPQAKARTEEMMAHIKAFIHQ
ncbi:hypothetical protein LguiB_019203 [Lonicera macranthoides]